MSLVVDVMPRALVVARKRAQASGVRYARGLGAVSPAQEVPRNRRIQPARPTWFRFERA